MTDNEYDHNVFKILIFFAICILMSVVMIVNNIIDEEYEARRETQSRVSRTLRCRTRDGMPPEDDDE